MSKNKKEKISRTSKGNAKGITLIELIIVIVLIGILILIFITYFRSQLFKANDAKRKGDIERIKIAIEEYEKDHNCYPAPQLVTCDPGNGLSSYLEKIPCDPVTNASYYYDYDASACSRWFRIYTNVEESDTDAMETCGPSGSFNYFAGSANAPSCQLSQSGNFYGCRSGVCVPIFWDESRPGPECDPNFQSSTCYGQCGPTTECVTWSQQ